MADEKNDKFEGGKGKARASDDGEKHVPRPAESLSDPFSRIVDSATGLARSALSAGNTDASRTISSSSLLGGKAQSSGSGSGSMSLPGATALNFRLQASEDRPTTSETSFAESFRSEATTSGIDHEFSSFSSNDALSFPNSGDLQTISEGWSAKWNTTKAHHEGIANHGEYDDGADVRTLLSDPSFNFDTDPSNLAPAEEQSMDDLFPQNFSVEEQRTVNQMKAQLPHPPVHKPMPASHPLNLHPLSDDEKEQLSGRLQQFDRSMEQVPQSEAEKEAWLSDWDTVLNNYADEVWGDILPEVEAVKVQIEEARAGSGALDSKAVARLKMIMGHLQIKDGWPRT